ncbi:hypothetical protein HQQ80_13530 [Microbacteriaceae bacterium VKM Ac-2855]|nr:hypothetical protein [Microbacteriaceae bacterium VKM Ac-2855]
MARTSTIVAAALAGALALAQLGVGAVGVGALVAEARDLSTAVADQAAASSFTSNDTIDGFAERTAMTARGRALYYASHPSVEPTAGFNEKCGYGASDDIVLGCYTGDAIFISDVENADLDGIRDVTAAHEMLHAAWARETDAERAHLSDLLEAAYAQLPQDGELADRLDLYATDGLGDRDNELHSILGTEAADLGPELEAHYAEYFGDRSKVVALNAQYEAVFTALEKQIDDLSAQITGTYDALNARVAENNAAFESLNADISDFNARADAGDFASVSAFDTERAALLARSDALDAAQAQLEIDIDAYEALRTQLQALNADADALNKSIDSTVGGLGGF